LDQDLAGGDVLCKRKGTTAARNRAGRSYRFVFLISLLTCPCQTLADGLPVSADKHHITVEHTVIKLTGTQRLEVERLRRLTLTQGQYAKLRTLSAFIPRTLRVLSSRHEDCTCGEGAIAVWCRSGEVDVPHNLAAVGPRQWDIPQDSLNSLWPLEEVRMRAGTDSTTEWYGETVTTWFLRKMRHFAERAARPDTLGSAAALRNPMYAPPGRMHLVFDGRGRCYYLGNELSPARAARLVRRLAARDKQATVFIDLPPPLNAAGEARIRRLARRLDEARKGTDLEIWGDVSELRASGDLEVPD
jgi:hypothetical protein